MAAASEFQKYSKISNLTQTQSAVNGTVIQNVFSIYKKERFFSEVTSAAIESG